MKVEKIGGTENRLYQLIAPLVMKPAVLRQNNNYPFKTSVHHLWYVALEGEEVVGFMPLEIKDHSVIINNYYISGDNPDNLTFILQDVIRDFGGKNKLQSVTHTRHLEIFEKNGFVTIRTWKLYIKMEYRQL